MPQPHVRISRFGSRQAEQAFGTLDAGQRTLAGISLVGRLSPSPAILPIAATKGEMGLNFKHQSAPRFRSGVRRHQSEPAFGFANRCSANRFDAGLIFRRSNQDLEAIGQERVGSPQIQPGDGGWGALD